jgi:hypothetical protein
VLNDSDGNVRSGRKNLIINGGFDVWQRGTSFTTGFFADRFAGNHSGHTTTKSIDVPTGKGFGSSAQFVGTGSDPYFYQNVEGSAAVAGRVATFSFWIKGGLGQCYIYDGSYHPVSTTLIETVGSWTRRSITYTFATGSYNPLVRIGLPKNTSNTCHTTGWQLELGSVATDFEHRSYGEELALCQRYYYLYVSGNGKSIGVGVFFTTTDKRGGFLSFPVEMRSAPTLDIASGTGYYLVGYASGASTSFDVGTIIQAHKNGVMFRPTSSATSTAGYGYFVHTNHASARIAFNAEL